MKHATPKISTRTAIIATFVPSLLFISAFGLIAASTLGGAYAAEMVFATAAALLMIGIGNWWILHSLVNPLKSVKAFGQKILQGDLTATAGTPSNSAVADIEKIIDALKDMLLSIVYDVRGSAISIDTTVLAVHKNNETLSRLSEAQSESIRITSATLRDLSATLTQNSENAGQASAQIEAASKQIAACNKLVREVATTMDGIKGSSNKIADIVSVIDGIAFQTNILALNAAVEAARAGDQGRGFAVVAKEVRLLAGRAAQEAKDIRKLVSLAVENIEFGSSLVSKTDQAMLGVVSSIRGVHDYMSVIASASVEQSDNMNQITEAIDEFASMTHENSELAAKALEATLTLKSGAKSLAEGVSGFALGSDAGTADEALDLVQKATAFAREAGLQALIDDVNKLNKGRFVYKDLYISIYGLDGFVKAHGANRHFVGVDTAQVKDTSGKPFIAEILDVGTRSKTGWVDYLFAHPTTQEVKPKASYLELIDDVVITCGCYV